MGHPSVRTNFIRLGSVTTNRKNGLTGEQLAVGTDSSSVSTGPSWTFSVLTEVCHVGHSQEFVGTTCSTYGQSNMTIGLLPVWQHFSGFWINCNNFHTRIWLWKCRLQTGGHLAWPPDPTGFFIWVYNQMYAGFSKQRCVICNILFHPKENLNLSDSTIILIPCEILIIQDSLMIKTYCHADKKIYRDGFSGRLAMERTVIWLPSIHPGAVMKFGGKFLADTSHCWVLQKLKNVMTNVTLDDAMVNTI